MGSAYPLVPVANLTGFILALLPLLTKIRQSWNIGVYAFAIWVGVQCLVAATGAIVWSDNVENIAPAWCDISSHLNIGCGIAVPACSLAITRRLYSITRFREAFTCRRERIKENIIALTLCLGLPVTVVILYHFVQGARYEIWEGAGCLSAIENRPLTIILFAIPIILPAFSVLFYCPRIAWVFYVRRRETESFLASNPFINRRKYIRILILACVDAIVTLPLGILEVIVTFLNKKVTLYPNRWPGRSGFPQQIPAKGPDGWSSNFWSVFKINWHFWVNVILAAMFFALFGLTEEARGSYMRAFWQILKPFGLKPPAQSSIRSLPLHSLNINRTVMGSLFESSTPRSGDIQEIRSSNSRSERDLNIADIEKNEGAIESPPTDKIQPFSEQTVQKST